MELNYFLKDFMTSLWQVYNKFMTCLWQAYDNFMTSLITKKAKKFI